MALMTKTQQCAKLPQASKDALRESFAAISDSFRTAKTLPAETKKAMGDGCKQGADALTQMFSAMGC
jgi:phage-related minor tail protein